MRRPNRINVKDGEVDAVQRELGGVLRDVVVDAESRVCLASESLSRGAAVGIGLTATLLHTYQVPKSDLPTVNRDCIAMLQLRFYVTTSNAGYGASVWLDVDGVETSRPFFDLSTLASPEHKHASATWKVTIKPDTVNIRVYAMVSGTGAAYVDTTGAIQLAILG